MKNLWPILLYHTAALTTGCRPSTLAAAPCCHRPALHPVMCQREEADAEIIPVQLPRTCNEPLRLCGCEWKYAAIAYMVYSSDNFNILLSFSMPLILKLCSPVANLITCSSKSHDSAHGNESHLLWKTAMNSKHSPATTRPGDDLYLLSCKYTSS